MTRAAGAGPADEIGGDVAPPAAATEHHQEAAGYDLVDEMSDESFPTSDPPSTWAGADQPGS